MPNSSYPSANPVLFMSITDPISVHSLATLLSSGLDTAAATTGLLTPWPWPKIHSPLLRVTSTQHHSDATIFCPQTF